MPELDPFELLERQDKWYLGNGGMLVYAPPFPLHLRAPGFWDECHYGDIAVPRLLALSFALEVGRASLPAIPAPRRPETAAPPIADQSGGTEAAATKTGDLPVAPTGLLELDPHLHDWLWYPDRIEAYYYLVRRDGLGYKQQTGQRILLVETKRMGPDGVLHCDLKLQGIPGLPPSVLHVVAWTVRQKGSGERADSHSDFAWDGARLTYTQACASRAHARGVAALPLRVGMWGERAPDSVQVIPSHSANLGPRLAYTPLWDSLKASARLSGEVVGGNVLGSLVFAGLHWRCPITVARAPELSVYVQVSPVGAAHVRPDARRTCPAPTNANHPWPAPVDPTAAWREFMSLVPHFECSDAMLTRYYWYRWYGLRLNAVPAGGSYVAPAVTEGIAYFRGVISYSLMCHLAECQWLADPALAQGCLRNHLAHQTKAGHFAGHIYLGHVNDQGFYHTDVGGAARGLLLHHPSAEFRREIEAPLARLLAYYTRERDPEGLNLYDVRDQFETGQEYTSRYFHGDKRADLHGWEHKLRLKGVDVTCYVHELARFLAECATARGAKPQAGKYTALAERIREAAADKLWDTRRGFYFDYHAPSGKRSPYWAAVGFYPALYGLADAPQALALGAHLIPGGKFDTPWPTPTVPPDDPYYQADPRWRGERANCPWNGRVWPMVNSHIVDVLGRLCELDPAAYRPRLAWYLRRFVEMLHFEQDGVAGAPKDPARPNCFEHYHPVDGTACEYRGIDDYMHSWVVDPLLKYVAGVRLRLGEDGGARLTVDPLPFGLTHLRLTGCHLAGHRLDVLFNRDLRGRERPGYRVLLDGRVAFKAPQPTPWSVDLG